MSLLNLYRLVRAAAGTLKRAWNWIRRAALTAADFARRLVIYACLAAVIAADWILDRVDPEGDRK